MPSPLREPQYVITTALSPTKPVNKVIYTDYDIATAEAAKVRGIVRSALWVRRNSDNPDVLKGYSKDTSRAKNRRAH